MLISGGSSPRTQSRRDPAFLKGQQRRRPCRAPPAANHQPSKIITEDNTVQPTSKIDDGNSLFFINKARAAHEELEGNRRLPSAGHSSRYGRESPFNGYFPKLVDDSGDSGIGSLGQRSFSPSKFSSRRQSLYYSETATIPESRPSTPRDRGSPYSASPGPSDRIRPGSWSSAAGPSDRVRPGSRSSASPADRLRHPGSSSSILPSPDSSQNSTELRQSLRRRRSATPPSCPPNSAIIEYTHGRNNSSSEEHKSWIDDSISSVNATEIVSLAKDQEARRVSKQKHENISHAMQARQHTLGLRHIPGECLAAKRQLMDDERRYLDLKFNERPCLRSESFLNEELWESINDLSRECCDVLGPQHCHDCEKLKKRTDSTSRSVEAFPMNMTPEQHATMCAVRRMHPELSPWEVFFRIENGDISMQSLGREWMKDKVNEFSKSVGDKDDMPPLLKTRLSISQFNVPDGLGFFANIADLRTQLLRQQGGRRGRRNAIFQMFQEDSHLPPIEDIEVVQKVEVDWENPVNYFAPPLLSRAEIRKQQSHPRFYAGDKSKNSYILPIAPDLDTLASKSDEIVRKLQQNLSSYNEANGIEDTGGELIDENTWARNRAQSARSCMTTSTLDTDIVFQGVYKQMHPEEDVVDVEDQDCDHYNDNEEDQAPSEAGHEQE